MKAVIVLSSILLLLSGSNIVNGGSRGNIYKAAQSTRRPLSCSRAQAKCLSLVDIAPNVTPTSSQVLQFAFPCVQCTKFCSHITKTSRVCHTRLADYILTTCSRYSFQCSTTTGTRKVCRTCEIVCKEMAKPITLLADRRIEMVEAASRCLERKEKL